MQGHHLGSKFAMLPSTAKYCRLVPYQRQIIPALCLTFGNVGHEIVTAMCDLLSLHLQPEATLIRSSWIS